jgi:lysine 2,3-aminomutase
MTKKEDVPLPAEVPLPSRLSKEALPAKAARDYRSIDIWKDVTPEQWNDWRWQLRNRIMSADKLSKIIGLEDATKEEIDLCLQKFKMAVTPYYATLIDPGDPGCPIRRQSVPTSQELHIQKSDMADPLGEASSEPVEGLVHRYPDRVLLLLTHRCAMYCRHCTRRRVVGENDCDLANGKLAKAIEYIRKHTEVRDVLLSGGDPLLLDDAHLENILAQIRAIPHVEVIRIGTRVPVVMPMRITDALTAMLRKYHPLWINTHFNHPREITPESSAACRMIADAGIPLGNQTVLLRGVNNDAEILKKLFTELTRIRVRPYYLYQCDLSQGIGHFRTKVSEGIDIMKHIRGFISGYAVPTFVIDAPGGGGKVPINPEYVESMDDTKIIMRNYLDELYTYPNPDE